MLYSAAQSRSLPSQAFHCGPSYRRPLTDKLRAHGGESKPWMQAFGKLRHLNKETARINRIIEEEFERIEPEDWK
jgi:hypothetical protein